MASGNGGATVVPGIESDSDKRERTERRSRPGMASGNGKATVDYSLQLRCCASKTGGFFKKWVQPNKTHRAHLVKPCIKITPDDNHLTFMPWLSYPCRFNTHVRWTSST